MNKIKSLIGAFACIAIIAIAVSTASAQVGRIEGIITKADTKEPVVGAVATFYRTDIKGKYDTKSDKKGVFLHAGLPYVGTYTLVISGAGCAPYFITDLKPSNPEPIKVELHAGDGKVLTLDDVKGMSAGSKAGGGGGAAKPMSAEEQKKAQAEYAKAMAANEASKKSFEEMKKLFEDGKALDAKNDYNGAVNAYKEALKLDAEQTSIWYSLSIALYNRAVVAINESRTTKDAAKKEQAKADLKESTEAAGKAAEFITPQLSDPAKGAAAKKEKAEYLNKKAQAEFLLAKELNLPEMGEPASKDYLEAASLVETPEEKTKLELKAADSLFAGYKIDESITAYQAVLTKSADNINALYGLGIAYVNAGKFQEAADTLQQFVNVAPEGDARVTEAKSVIKDLIVGNNLKAPKEERRRAAPKKKT